MKPLWEDENCKDGGRWTIRTPKTHTAKFWEDLLLAMIGEQFEGIESGEVLGLVMSLKFNNDTISVWHRTASNKEIVAKLKKAIENVLPIEEGMKLEHEVFQEVLNAPPRERKNYVPQDGSNRGGFNRGGFRGGRGRGDRGSRGGFNLNTQNSNNK